VWIPALVGLTLVTGFVLHALYRVEHPLIDLRLVVTLANSAMFLFGVGFFGVAMLFPSYHKAQAAIKDIEIHYGAKHPKAGAKIADGPWAPVRCFTKARCSNVPSTSAQIPGAQRKRQTGDRRGMNGLAGKQVSGLIAVSRIAQTTLRSIRV
jgi:hypothetical protein